MSMFMKFVAIISLFAFGAFWSFGVVGAMTGSEYFESLNPVEQFFLFNIGIYVLLVGVIGGIISFALNGKLKPKSMLIDGFIAFIFLSFVIELWQAPYVIDSAGNFIITNSDSLIKCSSDYLVAWAWSGVGISGSLLYAMTYFITPVLAIIVAIAIFGSTHILHIFGEL